MRIFDAKDAATLAVRNYYDGKNAVSGSKMVAVDVKGRTLFVTKEQLKMIADQCEYVFNVVYNNGYVTVDSWEKL